MKFHPLLDWSSQLLKDSGLGSEVTPVRIGGVTGKIGYFGMTRTHSNSKPKMHKGVDLLAPEGWPVFACMDGIATDVRADYAGVGKGYGKLIYFERENVVCRYAHLKDWKIGQGFVRAGELVGWVGRTGNVERHTPSHLHWEIRINAIPVDPLQWLME